jgi:ABC-type polysaccharide/polyol phosphate export permease
MSRTLFAFAFGDRLFLCLLLDTVPVLSNEFRTVDTVLFWFPGIMFMPITLPPDKIFNLVATFEPVAEYSFHFVLKFSTN